MRSKKYFTNSRLYCSKGGCNTTYSFMTFSPISINNTLATQFACIHLPCITRNSKIIHIVIFPAVINYLPLYCLHIHPHGPPHPQTHMCNHPRSQKFPEQPSVSLHLYCAYCEHWGSPVHQTQPITSPVCAAIRSPLSFIICSIILQFS